jgi:hypothetical protein
MNKQVRESQDLVDFLEEHIEDFFKLDYKSIKKLQEEAGHRTTTKQALKSVLVWAKNSVLPEIKDDILVLEGMLKLVEEVQL